MSGGGRHVSELSVPLSRALSTVRAATQNQNVRCKLFVHSLIQRFLCPCAMTQPNKQHLTTLLQKIHEQRQLEEERQKRSKQKALKKAREEMNQARLGLRLSSSQPLFARPRGARG